MGKYRRIKRARISGRKFNLIARCFLADITSISCSKIVCVNRRTTDRYYNYFRLLVLEDQELERQRFLSEEEVSAAGLDVLKYDQRCGPSGTESLADEIDAAANDPDISAIVIDLETPGGDAHAVERPFESIIQAKRNY